MSNITVPGSTTFSMEGSRTVTVSLSRSGTYNNQSTLLLTVRLSGYISGDMYQGVCSIGNYTFGGQNVLISNGTVVSQYMVVTHTSVSSTYTGTLQLQFAGSYSGGGTFNLNTNIVFTVPAISIYSSCSAPSSVTVTINSDGYGNYIKPNGKLEVSWEGATGGTNNAIVGYDVYWRITKAGTNPTTSAYTNVETINSSTTSNTIITLSSATRGYIVAVGVRTRGAAGSSYYSGLTSSTNKFIINSLPQITSSFPSTKYVTAESNVTIPFTLTDNDSQDLLAKYNTSDSTPASNTTTNSTLTIEAPSSGSVDYYIWGYDGLEYSNNYIKKTIIANTVPSITSITETPSTYFIDNGIPFDSYGSYFLGYSDTIDMIVSATDSDNQTLTYHPVIQFRPKNSIYNQFLSNSYLQTLNYDCGEYTTSSFTLDVGKIAENLYGFYNTDTASSVSIITTYGWRVALTVNDGIDSSTVSYIPPDGKFYGISNAPYFSSDLSNSLVYIGNVSNSLDNIDGTSPSNNYPEIYKDFRVYFPYEYTSSDSSNSSPSLSNVSIKATVNGSSVPVKKLNNGTTGLLNNYYYVSGRLTNSYSSTDAIKIYVSYKYNNITKTIVADLAARATPDSGGSLTSTLKALKPFSTDSTANYIFTMPNPFNNNTVISNISDTYTLNSEDCINLTLFRQVENSDYSTTYSYSLGAATLTSDNLTLNVTASSVFNFNNDYSISSSDYVGEYPMKALIAVKNRWGEEFSTAQTSFKLNFNELAWSKINSIKYATTPNANNWYSSSSYLLQEGLYAKVTGTCYAYTADSLYFYLDGTITEDGNFYEYGSSSAAAAVRATSTSSSAVNFSIITSKIPEIFKNSENSIFNSIWRVRTKNTAGTTKPNTTTYSDYIKKDIATYEQIASPVKLSSLTFSSTTTSIGTFEYNFTISSFNEFSSYSAYINLAGSSSHYIDDSISIQSATTSGEVSGSNFSINDFCIQLLNTSPTEITYGNVNYKLLKSNTKISLSNYITINNGVPTVSYRKNYLGINNNTPSSNALLDIKSLSNDTDKILLTSKENQRSWVIDLDKGTITITGGHILNLISGTFT